MLVKHITIADRTGNRHTFLADQHDFLEPLEMVAEDGASYTRISLGGPTGGHRGGNTLHFSEPPRVNGYQIDPIPETFLGELLREPLEAAHHGISLLSRGESILIGTPEHGIILRWVGSALEAYGAGIDTSRPALPA